MPQRTVVSHASNEPLAYFLTFTGYGTWLRGDERGSVDKHENAFGSPRLGLSDRLREYERSSRTQNQFIIGPDERGFIEDGIREVCERRSWTLHALNVRTNHVHVVVSASGPPRPVLTAIKAAATLRLKCHDVVPEKGKVWTTRQHALPLDRR